VGWCGPAAAAGSSSRSRSGVLAGLTGHALDHHSVMPCRPQVVLYGYVRGAPLRPGARVHVAGAGDFTLQVRASHLG
jgi:hypothetical protein